MKGEVEAELIEHANDELRHADMLAMRIDQLGGTPLLSPKEWDEVTGCGYDRPSDPKVRSILEQNIRSEQCAIEAYNEILGLTGDKDPITYQMAFEILRDEVEHEQDLEDLKEDLDQKNW
jgi:bacterioferritin